MKGKSSALSFTLGQQRKMMANTGKLDLSNLKLDKLNELGNQRALIELNVSENPHLTSFLTLPKQACLKTIIANGSGINILSGLSNQPRLSSISLIDTPISKIDNFRIAVLLAAGPRISSINGTPVSKTERLRFLCYPQIARKLVNLGWIPVYPPPVEQDFRYLAQQFNIKAEDSDFIVYSDQKDSVPPSPRKASPEPTDFGGKIAQILRPLGFGIRCGDQRDEDILSAVDQMCKLFQLIENQ